MKTDNVRVAAFLQTKGHPIRGIEIAPEGYGVVSFDDAAQADAASFDQDGAVPAKKLLANYRALIRRLDEFKRGQRI